MKHVKQRMIEDMKLRGLAPRTQDRYLHAVNHLTFPVGTLWTIITIRQKNDKAVRKRTASRCSQPFYL